jgi:hypothetical protein
MAAPDRVPVEELEQLIVQLPGVERCRIAVNDLGFIEEVHVLASDRRPAKQTVRDIESALAAAYDIRLDHKRISVAQVRGVHQGPDLPRFRVHQYRMDLDPIAGRMTAEVQLESGEEGEPGVAGQHQTRYLPSQQMAAVAQATLAALNTVPELPSPLALRDLTQFTLAGFTVVAVAVGFINARGREETVIGQAFVGDDRHRAAAEAALDAYVRAFGVSRDPHAG